jgi:hypothetical protein
MKKILLAAGVLLISTATFAHNTPNSDNKKGKKAARKEQTAQVNDFVKTQFYEDFPDATNINFERTKYFDEASFTTGTHQMRAYYDIRNELVGTTEDKQFSDLPANAQREIQKKYSNYKVDEVINYDDNEFNDTDMTMFDTAFDGADNNFVVLRKNSEILIVKVDMAGNVSYFKALK